MASRQGKIGYIVTIIALVVTLLVVGGITYALNGQKKDPYTQPTQNETPKEDASDVPSDDVTTPDEAESEEQPASDESEVPKADPATLKSIKVSPLGVEVFYGKQVADFEFAVMRTPQGTQYAEFSAEKLKGTKCTNDQGVFASVIKNPSTNEDQTAVAATTKVGNDSYGLALAGKNCASDVALLEQYQAAFKSGFSSLKAL